MKLVVFGPDRRLGALRGDAVIDLSLASAKFLRERRGERYPHGEAERRVPPDLRRFIEAGPAALEDAERALEHLGGAGPQDEPALVHALSESVLHAPLPRGARVACAGANFADHAVAMAVKMRGNAPGPALTEAEARAQQRKQGIRGFWKIGGDPSGQDGELIYPSWSERLDYEGEIAILLGKCGKDIKARDARGFIWGATLLADWSIRRPHEQNPGSRFATSKNFDGAFSMGPCIAVGELDPFDAQVETWVNGERRQHYSTKNMVFDFAEYLEYLSTDFTFRPGDVISGGTAAGTAADSSTLLPDKSYPPDRFLKPGDRAEIRSPQIGTLRTRVMAKPAC
ncbi:MAG: fumarylacetoacetate hydrolase family protein [Stellaceae bacterium]